MIRKTHEQFIAQMQEINDNIEILTRYEKDKAKVLCKCKICGFEWWSAPSNLLQGRSCKQCHFNNMKKTKLKPHEQFIKELYEVNKDIKVLGRYTGRQNKVDCECLIHNEKFSMTGGHLLGGETGCKKCICIKNHLSGLKSHEKFVEELTSINIDIEVIGKYGGAKTDVEVKCLKCGHIWSPVASSLLCGYGCPCCKRSKGEEKLKVI